MCERARWWCGVVGMAAYGVALRLAVVYGGGLEWMARDSRLYLEQARALLDGGFIQYFPNGYPALIAAVWTAAGESVEPLVVANVALSTVAAAAVFGLAREWCEPWVGAVIAVLVFAHWPNHLRFVPRILSDVPAACLVTCGIWALFDRRGIAGGLLLGLAVTLRTNLIPIWLGASVLFALRERRDVAWRVFAAGALPVGLLALFGYTHTGAFALGGNLRYNLLKAIGERRSALHFDGRHLEGISTARAVATYLEYAWSNPWSWLRQRGLALWQMWGPWLIDADRRSPLAQFVIGLRTPLLVFGVVGFWMRRREWTSWLLALPTVSLTAVHVFFLGHPRFIVPAEPTLCILATYGLLEAAERFGAL